MGFFAIRVYIRFKQRLVFGFFAPTALTSSKNLPYSSTQTFKPQTFTMKYSLAAILIMAKAATAFPFVAEMPGVDSSLFKGYRNRPRQQSGGGNPGGPATCPNNPDHVPAPGITAQYPYNGAKNGLPGNGNGGYQVPAPGDTAHYFVAPGPNDIRGPCPGLNAAANHNFIAHDGITSTLHVPHQVVHYQRTEPLIHILRSMSPRFSSPSLQTSVCSQDIP